MKILTPLLEHRGPLVEFAPVGELFWPLIGVGCGGVLSDMMVWDLVGDTDWTIFWQCPDKAQCIGFIRCITI